MSTLILFSGGVESTAMLGLAQPGDRLLSVAPVYERDIQLVARKALKIANYYGMAIERASLLMKRPPMQMWELSSIASAFVAGDSSITAVWWGMNKDDVNALQQDSYDRVTAAWPLAHPTVPLTAPLRHLSKLEQWNMIPDEIKPHVHTCILHYVCGECRKCQERIEAGIPLVV